MNLLAPFAGTVVSVPHEVDDTVGAGTPVIVLEAMKMEHELVSDAAATVQRLEVRVGDTVTEGQLLAVLGAARGTPVAPRAVAGGGREALDEGGGRPAPGGGPRRPPSRGRRGAARPRARNRAREPRCAARRRLVRRVRPADVRRPGAAPYAGGA